MLLSSYKYTTNGLFTKLGIYRHYGVKHNNKAILQPKLLQIKCRDWDNTIIINHGNNPCCKITSSYCFSNAIIFILIYITYMVVITEQFHKHLKVFHLFCSKSMFMHLFAFKNHCDFFAF